MGAADRTFEILKFRTMDADADARKRELRRPEQAHGNGGDPRMFKIPNDPRVTRSGRFLRRFSIDELPQLFNVVKGEMSLVGPRPLILEEDQHVVDWRRQRLNLKPGITGLWQVLGRDDIPFDEMVQPRLRLRDHVVAAERPQADHPHVPRALQVAGLLAPESSVTLSPGITS